MSIVNSPISPYSLIGYSGERSDDKRCLTLKGVANYLKLAEKTAYRLAAEGKLPGLKVGGSWRFKKVDIESWIEKQKNNENEDNK